MKSIKFIVAALVAAGLSVMSAQASVTVNWSGNQIPQMSDSGGAADDGTQLAMGDLLEIGTFASLPGSVTLGNVGAVLNSFEVFGTGSINWTVNLPPVTGVPGYFQVASTATAGTTFGGNQIYLVAYNAATSGGASEAGIFTAMGNTSWVMPQDGPTASTTIDIAQLFADPANNDSLANIGNVVYGGLDYDSAGSEAMLDTANILPVPEPSTITLVALGMVGAYGLIRRRR